MHYLGFEYSIILFFLPKCMLAASILLFEKWTWKIKFGSYFFIKSHKDSLYLIQLLGLQTLNFGFGKARICWRRIIHIYISALQIGIWLVKYLLFNANKNCLKYINYFFLFFIDDIYFPFFQYTHQKNLRVEQSKSSYKSLNRSWHVEVGIQYNLAIFQFVLPWLRAVLNSPGLVGIIVTYTY